MLVRLVIFMFVCLGTYYGTQAKVVELFEKSGDLQKMYQLKASLLLYKGDILRMPDGNEFIYLGEQHHGVTTRVLKVTRHNDLNEYALRLPYKDGTVRHLLMESGFEYKSFINDTIHAYHEFEGWNFPIPRMYGYFFNVYALMEHIPDLSLSMKKFIFQEKKDPEILHALYKFAKEMSLFISIDDFHPDQVVYSETKKRWFLLDWGYSANFVSNQKSNYEQATDSIFVQLKSKDYYFGKHKELMDSMLDKLNEIVVRRRQEIADTMVSIEDEALQIIDKLDTQIPIEDVVDHLVYKVPNPSYDYQKTVTNWILSHKDFLQSQNLSKDDLIKIVLLVLNGKERENFFEEIVLNSDFPASKRKEFVRSMNPFLNLLNLEKQLPPPQSCSHLLGLVLSLSNDI